jgi:hypothetical protein
MRPLLINKRAGTAQNAVVPLGMEPRHAECCRATRTLSPSYPRIRIVGQADAGHLLDQRQDLGLDKFCVRSRHGIYLKPALAALRVLASVFDGDAHHRGYPLLIDQVVQGREQKGLRTSLQLMDGVNAVYIARQMGHANAQMLFKVYGRWIDGGDKSRERDKASAAFRHDTATRSADSPKNISKSNT